LISFAGCFGIPDEGKSQWTTPQQLSSTGEETMEPTITLDGSNRPHVAWTRLDSLGGGDEIYYTRWNGTAWINPENISTTTTPSSRPILITDSLNRIHLVWGERKAPRTPRPYQPIDALLARSSNGISWFPDTTIYYPGVVTPSGIARHSAAVDNRGNLFVVWEDLIDTARPLPPRSLLRMRSVLGWQNIRVVHSFALMPAVVADDTNQKLHIAYVAPARDTGAQDKNSVFYVFSNDLGTTWSDSILVSRSYLQPAFDPLIIIGKHNRINIVWLKDFNDDLFPDAIYHSFSSTGATWAAPQNVTNGISGNFFAMSVVSDTAGRLHLVTTWNRRIYYTQFRDSTWSSPEMIFDLQHYVGQLSMALGRDGVLHLVWNTLGQGSGGTYYSKRAIYTHASLTETLPISFALFQNYPNPFNPSTTIQFSLPRASNVTLKVFSMLGQEVATLLNEEKAAGSYKIDWNAEGLSSSVYFYRLTASAVEGRQAFSHVRKMLLVR